MYLSAKTLNKRVAATPKFCPKCHKRFLRLDTHLRNSASCKDLLTVPLPSTVPESINLQSSTDASVAILNITPQHQHNELVYQDKPRIKLPSTEGEWEDANSYFCQVVVPQVLHESSPDAKNTKLSDGIYNFFASTYGTKQQQKSKKKTSKVRSSPEHCQTAQE